MFDWIFSIFYSLAGWICQVLGWLYNFFEIFAGLETVSYKGSETYLINFFVSNTAISRLYWGMALIGIAMSFGFAIFSVVRKMFDGQGKQQHSMGGILTGLAKSIVIILGLSFIMSTVLNSTAILMKAIDGQMSRARGEPTAQTMTYTEEQYAAMARVLNTIGNYSLNPSYNSRFNVNKCFNEIRGELAYLTAQGVFDARYITMDEAGNMVKAVSWQASLQAVAQSASLYQDLALNVHNAGVSKALEDAMAQIRTNASFLPLKSFTPYGNGDTGVHLDRMLMLMGGMEAAVIEEYNVNGSLDDDLRAPYYTGEKDIYDTDVVWQDFYLYFSDYNYFIVIVAALVLSKDLLIICITCVARIFNMVVLYVVAPPFIATTALDDGAKLKQWGIAFVVQCFSVLGTIMAMQLFILFLPIIFSSDLQLFDPAKYAFLNLLAKVMLIYAFTQAASKVNGIITGILADNAGWQSVQAGDMSQAGGALRSSLVRAGKAVGGKALGLAASPITKPVSWAAGQVWGEQKNRWGTSLSNKVLGEKDNKGDKGSSSGGSGGGSGTNNIPKNESGVNGKGGANGQGGINGQDGDGMNSIPMNEGSNKNNNNEMPQNGISHSLNETNRSIPPKVKQ